MKNRNMETGKQYHRPVLCKEAIDALQIKPSGIYVDATFGGGGHARVILNSLDDGRLIAFDQDEDAAGNIPEEDSRFMLIPENFRYLNRFLRVHDALPVSGILADLGVSSHQFDTVERGFSIRGDAPLDMRMDRRQSKTAADVIRKYRMEDLWRIFEDYGEVRNARSLAERLTELRQRFPLKTIGELKNAIIPLVRGNERRYLAQVFQALRIEVNDEMAALQEFLDQAATALEPGGRLVVISFHSVEDRTVKKFMKEGKPENKEVAEEKEGHLLKAVFKKPVLPGKEEIKQNKRAASAKMRVAEKIK